VSDGGQARVTRPRTGALFASVPSSTPSELVDVLAEDSRVRLERIVSTGHVTAPGEWYDQDRDEWVVVLRGRARLMFEDGATSLTLGPGDWVDIPAHCRHRVDWTDPDEPTVWLAVHR
jgi:cupin 2 domain-containing protein